MNPPQQQTAAVVSLKDGERRLVAWPNPKQSAAYETPRVLTLLQQETLQKSISSEMTLFGFRDRHVQEAMAAVEAYGNLSREWYQQHRNLADDELNHGGLTTKVNQFVEDCRRAGLNVRLPSRVDEKILARMRRNAVARSQALTQKMTGGTLILIVAVAIKTYLLWPLSTALLAPVSVGVNPTKSSVGLVLALALGYALTFVARVLVMMLMAVAPGDKFASHRNPGQLFSKKVTTVLAIATAAIFGIALWSFAQVDLANFTSKPEMVAPVYGVTGLSMLFLGIVLCFEMFWAYKTMRLQDEPDADKDHYLGQSYIAAVERLEDEKAVSTLRTLALDAQGTVYSFMEALDRVVPDTKKTPRQMGDAMQQLRRTLTPTRRAHPDRLWW